MMIEHPLITRNLDVLGGTPVFTGTRVPIQTLLDYNKAGHDLESFLGDYPSVSREHAAAMLLVLRRDGDTTQ